MAGKRDAEMKEFWASLPSKLRAVLYIEDRRIIVTSDELPLNAVSPSRLKSSSKFLLFTDSLVIIQGSDVIAEYPLTEMWIEHMIPIEGMLQSVHKMLSFRVMFPEVTIELQCKDLCLKTQWLATLVDACGNCLKLHEFVSGKASDLSLEGKLELLRKREYMEYTFKSLSDYKDGTYKGQWKDAKPHGIGEFSQTFTGQLYKGGLKEGKFNGEGEMLWFADKDSRKKYIGSFRSGEMEGYGEMKYSSGDVYSGSWSKGQRVGFGKLEEVSHKSSVYLGEWVGDKKKGYGIYDDKMKHTRYLGMWIDDLPNGPGMMVSSMGTYCEAIFTNGAISGGSDGFVIDPSGKSFMGRLGPDLKLAGKGILTLSDNTRISGWFSGSWHNRIEITKATLEESSFLTEQSDLQVARLDSRIGNITVMASNKWEPLFFECEKALGFLGSDAYSGWNKPDFPESRQKSNTVSISTMNIKAPVNLITLERARTFKYGAREPVPVLEVSTSCSSSPFHLHPTIDENMKVCQPLCLDSSNSTTTKPVPYFESGAKILGDNDSAVRENEYIEDVEKYINKAFQTSSHPLANLMNKLELVFHSSYGGIGSSKFLLPHAIAETHSIIKCLYGIVRSVLHSEGQCLAFHRLEATSDLDDNISISSGCELLHPLVFTRLFPTLITLYVLHHEEMDRQYQSRVALLKQMNNTQLMNVIKFPSKLSNKIFGHETSLEISKVLGDAANTLNLVNSLFTPGEFLKHFKDAFKILNSVEKLHGDILLPSVIYILVMANVPHLGAYLHFLTDFAHTKAEDDYTLVTYEAAYNFVKST